jgi:hypothetical protein
MKTLIYFTKQLAYMLVASSASIAIAAPVDLSKLPLLAPGDISFTNNSDTKFWFVAEPQGCVNRVVEVDPNATVHIRCANAKSIKVLIRTSLSDGKIKESTREYPSSAHYMLGIETDNTPKFLDIRYRGR